LPGAFKWGMMLKELGYDEVNLIRLLKIGTFAGSPNHIAESAQGGIFLEQLKFYRLLEKIFALFLSIN
jgi:hypothetical protein